MVNVEVPAPGAAMMLGLKLAVVPKGKLEIVRLIALSNPYMAVVVIPDVPCCPCKMLSVEGAVEMVNDGGPFTVSATVVLCMILPPLPVTVTV